MYKPALLPMGPSFLTMEAVGDVTAVTSLMRFSMYGEFFVRASAKPFAK